MQPSISIATIENIKDWILNKGFVVCAYPRKGIVVVNGFKRYSADKATCQAVKLAYQQKLCN